MHHQRDYLLQFITTNHKIIRDWITDNIGQENIPIYSSVDIRDAGFKSAVVDTNFFPSGFNNLCSKALLKAAPLLSTALKTRYPNVSKVGLIIEPHTRNSFYLDHVWQLLSLFKSAGLDIQVATFMENLPGEGLEIGLSDNRHFRVIPFRHLLSTFSPDLLFLNHDLSQGIPTELRSCHLPIIPSLNSGWHQRLKSKHFFYLNRVIDIFSKHVGIDPWLLQCCFKKFDAISIQNPEDCSLLADAASDLFKQINSHYQRYKIDQKPFLFLKADSGTYGMGVYPIESPDELCQLNRKARNKLSMGKYRVPITRYILQEGVPSITNVGHSVGEACLYHIESECIGAFYRLNQRKNNRQNLNATGMSFRKICADLQTPCTLNTGIDTCGESPHTHLSFYQLLGQLAVIAAKDELIDLEIQATSRQVRV
ncbi:MAG: glutamate--cysteine ligase [bacterium]